MGIRERPSKLNVACDVCGAENAIVGAIRSRVMRRKGPGSRGTPAKDS